jgi:TPP-dependent indolepyruvate ferredoxin oxidoreductase alpha subunit
MSGARRVILCSGKIYYDLADFREKHGLKDTAIIRLEQIYPLHEKKLQTIVFQHSPDAEIVWCQEEPKNMGAWNHLESKLRSLFKKEIRYAGRRAAASPATGALAIHNLEQDQLLASAFNFKSPSIPNPQSPIPPAASPKLSEGPLPKKKSKLPTSSSRKRNRKRKRTALKKSR